MSEFKNGDKVVLIGNTYFFEYDECTGYNFYKVELEGGYEGIFYDVHENDMQSYDGFLKTYCKQEYERGLSDAWEVAKLIDYPDSKDGLPYSELQKIFGESSAYTIRDRFTIQEIITKIKEWEDSKEIRRGDEVIVCDEYKGIVTKRGNRNGVYGVFLDGESFEEPAKNCIKTGRNFADRLDALLGELQDFNV